MGVWGGTLQTRRGGQRGRGGLGERGVFPGGLAPRWGGAPAGGVFEGPRPRGVEPAVTFVDVFKANAGGRTCRRRHRLASQVGCSCRLATAQPRTRSRRIFSARARSRAYSSSQIVPSCRLSSSLKRGSFSTSSVAFAA